MDARRVSEAGNKMPCLVLLLSFFNFLPAFRNGDLKPSDKREKLITHSGNVDHVEEETKKKNLLGKRLLQQEAPYPAWVLAQRWRGEHQELPRLG